MKVVTSLNDQETLKKIQNRIEEFEGQNYDPSSFALELMHSLEKKLRLEKIQSADLAKEYSMILAKLRINLFPFMTSGKVYNFFRHYFLSAVKMDAKGEVDYFGKLKSFLVQTNDKDRNQVINRVKKTMSENREVLGEEPILLDNKKVKPTMHNWLEDYKKELGTGKQTLTTIRKYLFEAENPHHLSREERQILNRYLRYFESLKLPYHELGSPGNYSPLSWGLGMEVEDRIDDDIYKLRKPELDYKPETKTSSVPASVAPAPQQQAPQAKSIDQISAPVKQAPSAPVPRPPVPKPAVSPSIKMPEPVRPQPQELKMDQQRTVAPGVKAQRPQGEVVRSQEEVKSRQEKDQIRAKLAKMRSQTTAPPTPKKREVVKRTVVKKPEQLGHLSKVSDLEKVDVSYFRQLGKNDEDRSKNFFQQIEILKSQVNPDELRKMWQMSPLYKLYLQIGRQSMTSDMSVAEVGKQLFNQSKPYLTEREFEMIAEVSAKF
ncbi:hypothetical protein KKC60_03430 [Patescibacteria group bacterium]|nr:hypothetical protein [Patescibacteria group bacterium]